MSVLSAIFFTQGTFLASDKVEIQHIILSLDYEDDLGCITSSWEQSALCKDNVHALRVM